MTAPAAMELSGLALSRTQRRLLWAHNDSGDSARLFALDHHGAMLAEVGVIGAVNVDWEGIAAGRQPGGAGAIFVGDIGDNLELRSHVVVYRAREPRVRASNPPTSLRATALRLRYPDGPHDAEALLVAPDGGSIVIVTKDFAGDGGVYVARPAPGGLVKMRRSGTVELGIGQPVTGGDVSANGRTIVLRSYERAFVWRRRRGEPLARALGRRPCIARRSLMAEGQGEAIALTRDGGAFYTVPEGGRPALRRYEPAA